MGFGLQLDFCADPIIMQTLQVSLDHEWAEAKLQPRYLHKSRWRNSQRLGSFSGSFWFVVVLEEKKKLNLYVEHSSNLFFSDCKCVNNCMIHTPFSMYVRWTLSLVSPVLPGFKAKSHNLEIPSVPSKSNVDHPRYIWSLVTKARE